MHKRPEIELRAFAKTIETQPIATLHGHFMTPETEGASA